MTKQDDPLIRELVAVKKLLVLSLMKQGLTQTQVAGALDIDRTGVSRMFPKGILAAIAKGTVTDE